MKLDKLFEPGKIGNCIIPNRMIVPAMNTNFSNEDGTATERYIRHHEAKAKGGWGLIITEDYSISKSGNPSPRRSRSSRRWGTSCRPPGRNRSASPSSRRSSVSGYSRRSPGCQ